MAERWTEEDLRKKGIAVPPPAVKGVKLPGKIPAGVQFIKNQLTLFEIGFVCEYQFHDTRKFRFDFAIPDAKIAIEYEGLMSEKSGHTTLVGYTKDTEKYNLAAIDGWRILRYTAKNYKDFTNDIKQILK